MSTIHDPKDHRSTLFFPIIRENAPFPSLAKKGLSFKLLEVYELKDMSLYKEFKEIFVIEDIYLGFLILADLFSKSELCPVVPHLHLRKQRCEDKFFALQKYKNDETESNRAIEACNGRIKRTSPFDNKCTQANIIYKNEFVFTCCGGRSMNKASLAIIVCRRQKLRNRSGT